MDQITPETHNNTEYCNATLYMYICLEHAQNYGKLKRNYFRQTFLAEFIIALSIFTCLVINVLLLDLSHDLDLKRTAHESKV